MSGAPSRFVALPGIPRIAPGDDLVAPIEAGAARAGIPLRGGVLVVCQKIVSLSEGRVIALDTLEPSPEALSIAREDGRDPRHVECVLRESVRIVRRGHGALICETPHGFVCANAGVDLSNAPGEGVAVLLPRDPDASAAGLRARLAPEHPDELGVIVSDTFGRPWREGLLDVAIGCSGIAPIRDQRGSPDLDGRTLAVTALAAADALAATAGLWMTKASGIPAVFVEGAETGGSGSVRDMLRDPRFDLFR